MTATAPTRDPGSGAARATVRPLDAPLGAEICGVDLSRAVRAEDIALIEDALHRYEVIVFRRQSLSDAALKRVSLAFGSELNIHPLHQFNKPDAPEITVLSNILGDDGRPIGAVDAGQHWHSDLSYTTHPSRVTLLYALEVPFSDAGLPLGETQFASTSRAYEALPEATKARLAGRRASHLAQKPKGTASHFNEPLTADVLARLQTVVHPVVRTHPYTGRPCLYVSRGFTVAIEGMDRAESDALLDGLYEHMARRDFIYTHAWAVGDLVINDNCSTVHKGTPNYKHPQRRLVYRTIVKGTVPY